MKKVMKIEGMKCPKCQERAAKVLNELDGVTAEVSLDEKMATITTEGKVNDDALKKVITDAGYQVVSLTDAE